MKKLISLTLALVLAMSLSVTAFASEPEPITTVPKNKSFDITAVYTKPDDVVPKVYYFTVSWQQEGTITYTDNKDTYTWNPTGAELKYDHTSSNDADWTCTAAKVVITVENKSNDGITATCGTPAMANGITGITGSYADDKSVLTIGSAAPADYKSTTAGTAQSDFATYNITDVEGAISANNATIATITVTVAATTPSSGG